MHILVTGAAGFLGSRLVAALLERSGPSPARITAADLTPCAVNDSRVQSRIGSVADPAFVAALFEQPVDEVYHLAAVLSGQSEAEFDTGLRVNVDATRQLLEACRALPRPPRFVFASTIAVFGAPLPEVVPEDFAPRPLSSYGAWKAIGELLVSEYSRRGFVDGAAVRLPTIAVRPGRPNSALSSFVSGIIREPLAGEAAVCPVPLDTRLWISSPAVATQNLVHAGAVAAGALGQARVITLPGISVTPAGMLDALERAGGAAARARVRTEIDPHVAPIVSGWPGAFDVQRALRLGFHADTSLDALVDQFMRDCVAGGDRRPGGCAPD